MSSYFTGWRLIILNIAIGLGTFIQVLDTSIANVAIPYIAGNLSVSADQGTWVITSFAASNAIVLPLTGWLSDYFGRIRLFVGSVLLFVLTSFLCGLSTSLPMLVIFRILQGAVAGALIPLSQSLIVAFNPPEKQGGALGFWGMVVVVAPVLGPIIGGYLTDTYSWPWIFYINVPIGLISAFVTWHFLKDHESTLVRNPIDWMGLFLLSLGVACLQIMLDKGKDLDWFESNTIIALTILSAIALIYFCVWNSFQKYPIVDFSCFKNKNFTLGTIAITIGFLVYFGSTITTPLWLQLEQGYTPFWAGLAVAPIGIAPFFLATWVGRNMQRFDARKFAAMSFAIFAIGFFYQAGFTTQVSVEKVMIGRFIQGFGVAFFFLPLVQVSLGEIPKERYASAAGLFNFIRILIGSGFGTSLSIQLWSHLEIYHHARLSDALTEFNSATADFYARLSGYSSDVATRLLDTQVEQQAYMLATNDVLWLGAWLNILIIPFVFLCTRVQPSDQQAVVH
ncbi:MAG: DHA2 family efflux MFS transporter permease subunit [Verrucomicrobia bacterium]|nr:DHA2 family efflux MFS transporter permease subunit [Verrucomicrobiota bacterium]MBS0636663.1 DHA2 family efflux MFS transporter permease subunit [Verrucomicrobiota bacterium]